MNRMPVVAGRFYPGVENQLREQVQSLLNGKKQTGGLPTRLVMVPHAGYMFSGSVTGRVLAQARLADTALLLGPNHTGLGAPLALWSEGKWFLPGGGIDVDQELANALAAADARMTPDATAHEQEHSLEVVLPFLQAVNPKIKIVPLAVAENRLPVLLEVAERIAGVLSSWPRPVTLVVSSDMSHYLPQEEAKSRDRMALDRMEALDPKGLYQVVRRNNITMCGVLPMTLGMEVCRILGSTKARMVSYATSGDSGAGYQQVVGYAGVIVD